MTGAGPPETVCITGDTVVLKGLKCKNGHEIGTREYPVCAVCALL